MPLNAAGQALWFHVRLRGLLTLGLRSSAIRLVTQRLADVPDDTHALATLAHLLAAQGQPQAAAAHLQRLLTLRPDDASAWFNLGYVHEQLGQATDAEVAFARATQLAPGLDRAWYGLGLSLIGQQRLDEAVVALRRATELQPMSPHGWYQLARVHAQRQELEQAGHIIEHLRGFEPRVAAQLVRETGLGTAPAPT